jgi:hypothetical protein
MLCVDGAAGATDDEGPSVDDAVADIATSTVVVGCFLFENTTFRIEYSLSFRVLVNDSQTG